MHGLTTPVVSAIGHEPDSPILDLVADVRASTPTDAAKLVVPDVAEEAQQVLMARERLRRTITGLVRTQQDRLDALRSRPSLGDPRGGLIDRRHEVSELRDRSRRRLAHQLDRSVDDLGHQIARVRALSPLATLRRGYAVLSDAEGRPLSSIGEVGVDTEIGVRLADGRITATTTGVTPLPLINTDEDDDG